ncbi:VWA domain-containing protein [Pilimelia columellifera]|uniref:VWFA domain-containing protein n=1 Tax=Pilimelia columellifera subsp. columellifera TaxID=706583 RepID=A0ABP6AZW1_9ACTN
MTVRRLPALAAAAAALCALATLALTPAAAGADGPAVAVTGVQATPGAVEFFLAASALPAGVSLADATVTVHAGQTPLHSTVRAVGGAAGPDAPRRAVVLVLDTSGSMANDDRIGAARAAALDYAATAPEGVWLGLVTVSDVARAMIAPTANRPAFTAAVNGLTATGKTALYDGVEAARAMLDPRQTPGAAAFVERRVVVLSDGEDTASTTRYDRLAGDLSRATAIVDAVAFGEADQAELAGLTGPTGGEVFPAANAAGLRAVFRTMAAGLTPPLIVRATVPPQLSGQSTTLQVSVAVGGTTLAASVPTQLRADPAAATGPESFQVSGATGLSPTVLAAVVGVALFALVLVTLLPLVGRSEVQQRLSRLDRFVPQRGAKTSAAGSNQMLAAALSFSERAVRRPDRRERIELALDRAGSNLRAAEWQLIRAGVAAGGAIVGALILPVIVGLPLGAIVGWLGSAGYLRFRAGRRTRRFAEQLPESLQLVVGSLRSGFSLPQSIDALVREGAEPVASELGRALAETRLGGDLEDALEKVGERNGSQDMRWLVMAIRIQREVGGNLSEVLETAVETMRERGRLFRHVRALSAEGRLSAMVLLGMPIVLGLWMFFFRNEYVRPLYTEPLGIAMLVASTVMIGIGAFWLSRIVKVEV